jgi:hypothetical protein
MHAFASSTIEGPIAEVSHTVYWSTKPVGPFHIGVRRSFASLPITPVTPELAACCGTPELTEHNHFAAWKCARCGKLLYTYDEGL